MPIKTRQYVGFSRAGPQIEFSIAQELEEYLSKLGRFVVAWNVLETTFNIVLQSYDGTLDLDKMGFKSKKEKFTSIIYSQANSEKKALWTKLMSVVDRPFIFRSAIVHGLVSPDFGDGTLNWYDLRSKRSFNYLDMETAIAEMGEFVLGIIALAKQPV